MKNISIRKAIGLCYLGLGIIAMGVAFSVQKTMGYSYSDPFTQVFIITSICSALCFFSFVIWTFTHSMVSRYLGYFTSLFILLLYTQLLFFTTSSVSVKFLETSSVFLASIVFLILTSYSSIAFPTKKKKQKELEVLDSQMLYENDYSSKKQSYFWSIHCIYSITIAILAFPWLLIALYSSNSIKGITPWEITVIALANILAVLFWLKSKWAKTTFIVLVSIALCFGLVLVIVSIFEKGYLKIEGILTAFGISTLFLSLILILLSKEAKRESIEFEKNKN